MIIIIKIFLFVYFQKRKYSQNIINKILAAAKSIISLKFETFPVLITFPLYPPIYCIYECTPSSHFNQTLFSIFLEWVGIFALFSTWSKTLVCVMVKINLITYEYFFKKICDIVHMKNNMLLCMWWANYWTLAEN